MEERNITIKPINSSEGFRQLYEQEEKARKKVQEEISELEAQIAILEAEVKLHDQLSEIYWKLWEEVTFND